MFKGKEELITVFAQGKILSVTPHDMESKDGTIKWYSGNFLINGQILQNVTIAGAVEPEDLEVLTKDYTFGIQINQEVKGGYTKNGLKVVYVTDEEEIEYLN